MGCEQLSDRLENSGIDVVTLFLNRLDAVELADRYGVMYAGKHPKKMIYNIWIEERIAVW